MKKRTYLDYAASTPVDPRVERAMRPYFMAKFGNPGSLHSFGQEAIAAVDAAREIIARSIGADFREVIFAGSATEANNLALRGAVAVWKVDARHKGLRPRIVTLATEHESVLETVRDLEGEGAEIAYVPVNKEGVADLAMLASLLDERTAVASVMYVNNEIGTVQPVAAIAEAVRAARAKHSGRYPLFHTDAAQAFSFLNCGVRELGVDMMTFSAHKIYGPKGVGALFVRGGADAAPVAPLITGGGQEFGLRSGTENVPLIAGFAKAVELALAVRGKEAKRITALQEYAIKGIKKILKDAEVNGPVGGGTGKAAAHILNVYLPGRLAEDVVMRLDLEGVAVSSGSACRARAIEPSYVIRALGHSEARARSSIRVSFGRPTTRADVDRFLAALKLFSNSGRNK